MVEAVVVLRLPKRLVTVIYVCAIRSVAHVACSALNDAKYQKRVCLQLNKSTTVDRIRDEKPTFLVQHDMRKLKSDSQSCRSRKYFYLTFFGEDD